MTIYLKVRRAPWCMAVTIVTVAIVAALGPAIVPFPSLMTSDLQLPLAVVTPLAVPAVLGWSLASSDPRVERGAARALGGFDTGFVLVWTALAAIGAVALTGADATDAGAIAARAVVGYVGLLLCARLVLPTDVAVSLPLGYLLCVSFLAGGSVQAAPMWAWVLRPTDDVASWVVAGLLLVGGSIVLWRHSGDTRLSLA